MDERDILSRIRARYPARLFLAFVGGRSLRLHFGASIDEQSRAALMGAVAQIPLDIRGEEQPADLDLWMERAPCPEEEGEVLWLRCGEQRFALLGEDPSDTLMWTLYCLAKELPALRALRTAKLRAETYSASQQALAAKLLRSADYWQQTLSTELLPKLLEGRISKEIRELTDMAPRSTDRPFTAEGRERVKASLNLFAKERQEKLSSLAKELYGERPFSESLRDWTRRMEQEPAFREALQRAREEISKELFRLPMMEVSVRLRDAVQELERRFDPREDLQKAAEALRAQAPVKRLEPGTIQSIFKTAEEHYREAARKSIASAMLAPLAAWLKERVEGQMPSALRTMQDWNRSLRDFCRIHSGEDRLPIGWDRCGELRDEELTVAEDGWTGPFLRDLYHSAAIRGYDVLTWAGSPAAIESVRPISPEMAREMLGLQGMTEQLVVALLQRPILTPVEV